MAVETLVIPIIQLIFSALNCTQLKGFLKFYGYKSDLDALRSTVSIIEALFRNAEAQQDQLSDGQRKLMEELRDAVLEADDLLDEYVTLAKQKELIMADGHCSKKVRRFFSLKKDNPLRVACRMSKGIKKIKKKLDAIAYNNQFKSILDYQMTRETNVRIDSEPIRNRRSESCSYVNAVNIIGREDELDEIVNVLKSDVNNNLSFLSIVGIGGLGKTALAQLVFNDPRVTSSFQLKMWTCVADENQDINLVEVLRKILASATQTNPDRNSILDRVQSDVREQIAGKKFLLVLDDVWTESREQWCDLIQYLTGGQNGSWIIVTTRSQETAKIIADGQNTHNHNLAFLSKENSWRLFENTANPPDSFVEIGKKIVDGCGRVPLAIRVVGSLLYGQDRNKWEFVQQSGWANVTKSKERIMSILKLSYDHLEPPLKSCFSYCALFPKDYVMRKEMLISLWLAQGYVVPLEVDQSFENASEEYFSILLRRCFFQDINTNQGGEIVAVKIHDLMHDLAIDVSGKEMCYATSTISGELDKRVRHLSMPRGMHTAINELSLGKPHFRSYLLVTIGLYQPPDIDGLHVHKLVENCRSLRALDLSSLGVTELPASISQLLHLRYLSLSDNVGLKVLPESITNLYNLQTLDLRACIKLTKLPKDLNRLVNLRRLNIHACSELKYMPKNMNKLKYLTKLNHYIVGSEKTRCLSWNEWLNGLEDLKDLNNLNDTLSISIKWPDEGVVENVYIRKHDCLRNKDHLSRLVINFSGYDEFDYFPQEHITCMENMEDEGAIAMMEDLQPPSNLKSLEVMGYAGSRMPLDWACALNKLVVLQLSGCEQLEYLEIFTSSQEAFLPVLETLHLDWMPNLKGWRNKRGVTESSSQLELLPCLSHLKEMMLRDCPMLTSIPPCPNLEDFSLFLCPEMGMEGEYSYAPKFRVVKIDNVATLTLWPMEAFQGLELLEIEEDEQVENLGDIATVFRGCSSSLKELHISGCNNLTRVIAGGLEHLTALEDLTVDYCDSLSLSEETRQDDTGPTLLPSLRQLRLSCCPKVVAMPNWMSRITSLQELDVLSCSKSLIKRCSRHPQGEDWPYIQHIPKINVRW